jgi:hypothetical protein
MCRDHGKAVDSNDPQFTVELLRKRKRQAEEYSWIRVLRHEVMRGPAGAVDVELAARLRIAAQTDLDVLRRTTKWPPTSVELTLKVDGVDEPATTGGLASAVMSLDDLILVAPPGMGKTATLLQIAQNVLGNSGGIPLIVQLGDWATDRSGILESILRRPAFRGITEQDFRANASQPGVLLLLDGWNELDADARARARVQVNALKAELPELSLIVSTRRQAFDVPFSGRHVDLVPLSDEQQMQIATVMRGEAGAKLVDQAWRTPGVRELMTIPLYLTTLLSLPEGSPFPTTKEEILRRFVAAHEKEARSAEALHAVAQGLQQEYLNALAVVATRTANTSIPESGARRSISDIEAVLVANGQITIKPQPDAVLSVLVDNHMLVRSGDGPGFSFQHQQFQEWYASHAVERRIMVAVNDSAERGMLKVEILDVPAWEEAVLFAVERLARGDAQQKTACGEAILAALEVDPILAAEMIFRSTEDVWTSISGAVKSFATRWHTPGKIDRALRFMLTSGRTEFLSLVWPLITNANEQTSLRALRNCNRFRPSILGSEAKKNISGLPPKARTVVLYEIAMDSGMDGLDLAAEIAKDDPDPEVQASVVDALEFRRAGRHISDLLRKAPGATFDLLARKGIVDSPTDENVRKELAAARRRQITAVMSPSDRLHDIAFGGGVEDRSAELMDIISTMELGDQQTGEVALIHEARERYPQTVADALLVRLRTGRTLFHGSDDILASAGFILEDEDFLQMALTQTSRPDALAERRPRRCWDRWP